MNEQSVNISQEVIQRILGEKEMVILVLRSKIDELEKELASFKTEKTEKQPLIDVTSRSRSN